MTSMRKKHEESFEARVALEVVKEEKMIAQPVSQRDDYYSQPGFITNLANSEARAKFYPVK